MNTMEASLQKLGVDVSGSESRVKLPENLTKEITESINNLLAEKGLETFELKELSLGIKASSADISQTTLENGALCCERVGSGAFDYKCWYSSSGDCHDK